LTEEAGKQRPVYAVANSHLLKPDMKSHASMNRVYRLVWNAALSVWVAVAENAKGQGKSGSARNKAALLMLVPLSALVHQARAADAANATVSAGAASVATAGNSTTINQASQRTAIDWTSLSTRANEALIFNQPNAQAIALNRITGSSPSGLLGSLTANGQVFILNPNGVLFGAGSQVNVGGLVASTLSMSNADFMDGKHVFTGSGGSGSVVNQGTLNAASGGYLALLAPEVRNEGVMTASLGTALLAAGNKVTLNLDNGSLLGYSIDQGAINALAENKQLIKADGGQVLLGARALDSLTTATVNNTGVIEAKTLQNKAGRILLIGDMSYGTVNVGGTLDASAPTGGNGGFIETSAANVKIADSAVITTKAADGLGGQSGSWLIDPTDFTIAASGGDMTGAALSTQLANNGTVTILNTQGAGGTAGDINVNDAVSWSSNSVLILAAGRDINVNRAITATGASGGLVLNYGGDYKVKAPISLSGANATLAINGANYTLIHSMAALDAIESTGLSGKYALAGDMDAGGTTYSSALVSIANNNVFTGTFAGLGHTISNLTISAGSTDYVGLFSYIDIRGVIRDIGLVGGSISGGSNVGGLVGFNLGGSISNAYATGSVSGSTSVGGLVGTNTGGGSISNAYATGSVSGSANVGGLVGSNGGSISNAYATGSVSSSSSYVGGLVGGNSGSISNVYATGSVSSSSSYVGGLVGGNYGSISNAYAAGDVSGGNLYAGGLVGYAEVSSSINNAYSSGAVSGRFNTGGLVGRNYGSISGAYATGRVSGSGAFVAGLAGYSDGSISNSYWDSSSTGRSIAVGGGTGTTTNVSVVTSSATSHSSYANLGTWAETASGSGVWVANDGSGNTWVMVEGGTRPFLYSEYSTDIHNAHQLQLMAVDTSASYTLTANIDASETRGSKASGMWTTAGFVPVGNSTAAFIGSLDGQSHSISDLNINRAGTDYVGLFGRTGSASVISNVGLAGGSVSGANHVGALVGDNGGNISNSYASVAVSGTSMAGGLAGDNPGSISNSYASGAVSATGGYAGGLVGYNDAGSVNDSYAGGSVSAGSNAGGLVGFNNGGTVSNSFWNTATSGQGSSDGGTGISTAQMLQAGTFGGAGWSIAASGGSTAVWRIYEGYTAPLLRSFMGALTVTAGNVSKTYDGSTAINSNYTFSKSNADSSLILGAAASSTSTSSKNVGSYSIVVSGLYSGQQGYDLSFVAGTATVTAATLTVSGTAASNKTYDGTATATLSGSLSGLVSGDTVTLSQSGSFSDKNAATGKTVSYTSSLSGSDAGNYLLASAGGTTTADIAAATLTVSGSTAANKTYDGTTGATVSGGVLSGVISGDTVALGSQSGTFSDKNAATGKTVSYTSSLSGTDAGNYVVAAGSTTADITAATLTVSGTSAANKTYDGTAAATLSASLSGLVSGDTVALNQSGAFSDKNAATGKTVSYISSLSGSDAGNYVLASSSGTTTADISRASLSISGITVGDKTYNASTAATVNTAGASYNGLFAGDAVTVSATGLFSDKNAGAGKTVSLSSSYSGTDVGNYIITDQASTTASISQAALTVTGITAADKTYNASTAATVNTAGASYNGLFAGDVVSVAATGLFSNKNAGGNKTVDLSSSYSGTDVGNYIITDQASTTASISQAALTVTGITAADKTYNASTAATVNTAGAGYNGLFAGDVVSVAATGLFSDKNAGANKTVSLNSSYSGTDAGNYAITNQATTTASISQAALTVTGITASDKTYNASTAATVNTAGANYNGLFAGDVVAVNATGLFSDKNVGAGKTVTLGSSYSGADAGNYIITGQASTTASISQATLTISGITAGDKTYNASDAATVNTAGVSYNGLFAGDALTVAATGSFSDKNAGAGKTVNLSSSYSGADLGNYAITGQATTTATISRAALTVSGLTAGDKTYDASTAATVNAAGASYNGLFAGDVVNVSVTGLFSDKNAGANKTVNLSSSYSGADAGNYTITSQAGTTATIHKADLTVQATGTSKVYDGTTAANVAFSGNGMAGDALNITGSASFADQNAGLNKTVSVTGIAVGGADAGNYNLISGSTAATTADITPKQLTVTANNDTQMSGAPYSGGNGVSYNGLVTGDTATAVLAGNLAYGGSAQGAYLAGEYDITPGGLLANGNYSLRFVQGRLTLSGGDAASVALGGTALVGAYQTSLNSVSSGSLVPRVSVDDSKGKGDGDAAATALNAAAAEGADQGGGN
jgi:filamentous hemagglutinin family protein